MANLVSQSLKILSRAVKDTGKEYTSNLTSFINDARDVKNSLVNSTTDAADTYARIKRTNITKAIHDWFYQEETDSEAGISNDEFDAGFGGSDGGSGDEDSASKSLTAESMINISNKQTNSMIRVARKQTEQSVANTAEIISSLNSRSAEMLTSLNNINKTLLGISSRLDKVIELQSVPLTNQNEIDKGGLYQDGKLSLMRIFEQAKSNVLTTGPMSYITPIFDAIRSGTFGPTQLASMGLQFGAQKIKVNGKSVDDWGKAFNEMVGTATQTFMNELINTKALRRLLPGLTSMDEADKNYQTVVPNMYDNKRAVFDGMTKMSIINVIPQMLAKINESLSGQEYHLDSRGKWIAGPMKNEFNEVTRASFQSSGLNNKLTSSISNAGVQSIGKKIPDKDVTDASEALTMSLVMALHKAGDRAFSASRIKTELAAQIDRAVSVLVLLGRGDANYWTTVCQTIVMQLSSGTMNAAGFVSNVNQSLQRMIDEATKFAQTGKANASQATKLTFEMAANQYLLQHDAPTNTPQVQAAVNNNGTFSSANGHEIVNISEITGKFTTGQYVGGIFYLLNRGINVRIDKQKPWKPIELKQIRADVKPFESDDTFGKMVGSALAGNNKAAEDAVKNQMGVTEAPGFLSKFFENPSMALMSLTNMVRGGGTGGTGFFSNIKDKAKGFLGEDKYNKVAGIFGSVRDRVTHDDRFLAAQDKFNELRGKAADKLDELGHSRLVNNAVYKADDLRLRSSQNIIDHYTSNDANDMSSIAFAKHYIEEGRLDDALDVANGINDKNLKSTFVNMINIHKKRQQGQQDSENGNTPDIGSVLISRPGGDDDGKVEKDESQRSILGRMLGMVGKIAKGVAKLAARGAIDITMGLKSMAQGLLLGYKDTDANGNTHYNKGLVRNLFTVPLAGMAKGVSKVAKAGVNKIKEITTGSDGQSVITKGLKWLRGKFNSLLDIVSGGFGWLKTKGSDLLDKLKDSKVGKAASAVGNFLGKSKFVRGFTSGFKDAKAARDKLLNAKKREEDAQANPLRAEQTEMMEGKKPSIFTKMHELLTKITGSVTHQEELAEEEAENNDGGSSNAGGSPGPDIGSVTETAGGNAGGGGDAGEGGGGGGIKGVLGSIGSVIGDVFGNFGKMMGGMLQTLMGIGEMIISIVTSLEAFSALKDLVQSILVDGLQPLNEVFEEVIEAIKPVVAVLKETVKTIAEVVVSIAKSIIEAVQPILEALMPIIKTVIDFLSPILDIIKVLMDVIMVPIKITLDIISPVIEGIGYTLQVVSGVLQIGLGAIMGLLGGVVAGLGMILSWMPGSVGRAGDDLKETGQGMLEMSKNMLKAGAEQIKQGIQGGLSLIERLLPGGEDGKKEEEKKEESTNGSNATVATDFGAGDVPSTTINNNWSYTFGSGNTNTTMNQHSYGGYMNMSERGCGPVALADAYGRRGGGNVNPANLAAAMTGAGTYDPRRGTSVSSMINTGNAMGMGMRLGGVTAASLSQSSPTNPITVLGSGTGFGTRNGNNHYVNVVGTDGHGGAYVSNPMTGRVEKHATSNLVLNSKLGLYGSGDNDLEEFGFSDEAYESLENLKNITSKLTSIFTGESDAEKKINDANLKQKAAEIKRTLGDDYAAVEEKALADLKAKYPDLADSQIQRKLDSREGWNLIIKYGGQSAVDLYSKNADLMKTGMNDVLEGYEKAANSVSNWQTASQSLSSESMSGAEMTPFEPIIHIVPELTQGEDGRYYASPVHDFFNAKSIAGKEGAARSGGAKGLVYSSAQGGWFEKYKGPQNDEGVGSSGDDHEGVLLRYANQAGDGNAIARAITGGTVTYVTKGEEGEATGLGNSVKWRDSGGMYHWFMHMNSIDREIQEGGNLEPGQLIGYFGRSGLDATDSNGNKLPNVLRYVVTTAGPQGNTGDPGYINPFTYWTFKQISDDLQGDDEKHQIYNYLVNHFGMSEAAAAGVMGVLGCEGMLDPEPYSAQMEGYFGEGKAEKSKKYDTLQKMNDYAVNELFPGYNRQGTSYSQPNYYSRAAGLYLPGIGLAQWTADRTKGLFDFAQSKGMNWWDLQAQLDFIEAEREGTFNSLMTMLTNKQITPQQAADAWMTQYEAGGSGTDPFTTWLGSDQIIARRNKANALYKELYGHVTNTAAKLDEEGVYRGSFIGSTVNPNAIGADGYFSSAGGAVLANYGVPTITETRITSATSGNSPLHEFFSKTGGGGATAFSGNGNWYVKGNNPDSKGVGSSGRDHGGIDFFWDDGKTEGKELRATTGGKVNSIVEGTGTGNNVQWIDDAGYIHWYMHMRDKPLVKKDDIITGGQLLGYAGNTGDSDGAHLHYSIIDSEKFNGWSDSPGGVNPLLYFSNYNSAGPQTNANERGGLTYKTGVRGRTSGEQTAIDIINAGGTANYIRQVKGIGAISTINSLVDSGMSWAELTKRYDEDTLRSLGIDKKYSESEIQEAAMQKAKDYIRSSVGGVTINDVVTSDNLSVGWNSILNKNGSNNAHSSGGGHAESPRLAEAKADLQESLDAPQYSKMDSLNYGLTQNFVYKGINGIKNWITGGGDVSNTWYDALFGNNIETVSNYVPPLDESKLYDEETGGLAAVQNMVNRFNIRSTDSKTTDMLDRMSSMTFNVRAERVEQLLEILINKVGSTGTSDGPLPDLFEEGIPEAVTRLSIG